MLARITLTQLGLIVGISVGFIFGLIPLILGFVKQNRKLGVIGFILTIVGGTFFSLLGALPICGTFIWLILRKPPVESSEEAVSENETEGLTQNTENL